MLMGTIVKGKIYQSLSMLFEILKDVVSVELVFNNTERFMNIINKNIISY